MRKPVALVFGNEAGGLPLEELAGHIDGFVTVPMSQSAGSLNVGMAAAVLCFEVARQRRCA
jgi:TrmH family RNA methyltransferase